MPSDSSEAPVSRRLVFGLILAAGLAAIAVNAPSLLYPYLYFDDFPIFQESRTWSSTCANLWVPFNEHCWPIMRLYAWLVWQAAGSASGLPLAAAIAIRLLILTTMLLLALFVRRERNDAFLGYAAMILFGVSAVYQEAVYWFAASPAIGAAATTLAALLAAQRWRQTGRWPWLAGAAFGCAAAPGWFAGGILAGPLCGLYLAIGGTKRRWLALAPLLGSAVFLAISLPLAGRQIMHTAHYEGRSALDSFELSTAFVNSGRSIIDSLVLGAVGVWQVVSPKEAVAAGLILLAGLVVWLWRRAPSRRLISLGLGFILLNDLLIYGARAGFPYEQLATWSRYAVWPWLGFVLIVCGGIRGPARATLRPLTRGELRALGWLIAISFVLQASRGIFAIAFDDPTQGQALRQVDRMEEQCEAHRIAAADAVQALEPLPVPGNPKFNGWLFLRGSEHPLPRSVDETRRLLGE